MLLLQLQYYKQGKSDDFVKILEAARTGKSDTFIVSAAYCSLRNEMERNEMEWNEMKWNEMERNEMKICSLWNENL